MPTHHHTGACHCGAIRVSLAFTRPAAETQIRSCQCGFCRRHGTATVSDPDGTATWYIDAAHVTKYQFATATATSIICGRCGVYAGAILTDGDKSWSIANTRGLAMDEFAGRTGDHMDYEQETAEERIERRKRRWTPTVVRIEPRAITSA